MYVSVNRKKKKKEIPKYAFSFWKKKKKKNNFSSQYRCQFDNFIVRFDADRKKRRVEIETTNWNLLDRCKPRTFPLSTRTFPAKKNFKQLTPAANSYADIIVFPVPTINVPPSCDQVIPFEAHFSFGSVTIRKTVRPFSAIKLNSRVNSREREDRRLGF